MRYSSSTCPVDILRDAILQNWFNLFMYMVDRLRNWDMYISFMTFALRSLFSNFFFLISSLRNRSVMMIRISTRAAIIMMAEYRRFCDLLIVSMCACCITGSACEVCNIRITAWHFTELSRAMVR